VEELTGEEVNGLEEVVILENSGEEEETIEVMEEDEE